ncbi:MAG: hypothetical protein JM58_19435 [Peptococcaceae bacterium BICA1-8]|nr:MAG: hypothetical protein JM58_19435 [Peptococcaceae bacterium BICA1-8]
MYISIQDLATFLIACIVIATGTYFFITLMNINNLLKDFRKKFNNNEDFFKNLVKDVAVSAKNIKEISGVIADNKEVLQEKLPKSIENAYIISTILKNTAQNVDNSVEVINGHLLETASTVKENTQDIFTYMKIISEGLRVFIQVFTRSK